MRQSTLVAILLLLIATLVVSLTGMARAYNPERRNPTIREIVDAVLDEGAEERQDKSRVREPGIQKPKVKK